nr:MAG TPA: hypothetical protein [Caudoviricetes sp.]
MPRLAILKHPTLSPPVTQAGSFCRSFSRLFT